MPFCRIVNDIAFHTYKTVITQELKPHDHEIRVQLALIKHEKLASRGVPCECLLISDEAHFALNGNVNKQNCRYYAEVNL